MDLTQKKQQFEAALKTFLERVAEDRYVLAVVLVGSLSDEVMWRKETIRLWVIETDGVTRRLRSDGNDERIFRTLVEDGINLHVEVIPRSRFKRMIEGASRTAFTHNFFALRELVYCDDPSIESWFEDAQRLATRDQEKELLAVTAWIIHAHRHADNLLHVKQDLELGMQELLWAAHGIAAIEIILRGQVVETEVIYKALEYQPELFRVIYLDLLSQPRSAELLETVFERVQAYLDEHAAAHLKPLLKFLRKQNRIVPLSEISDHFAHTQLYPWHLESACEWLERRGQLDKLSAPFKLTTKSRVDVEEPAYSLDG